MRGRKPGPVAGPAGGFPDQEPMSSKNTSSAAYRPDPARGVVVPFTTPQFMGARLRVNGLGRFELLLRNPAGGKGVYLIELGAAHRFSSISLHDRILHAEIQKLSRLSPRAVRLCARRVALSGAAGHEARLAARVAARREEETVGRLRDHLLGTLLGGQAAGNGTGGSAKSLTEVAAEHRVPVGDLADGLREIAEHAAAIGLPAAAIPSGHADVLRDLVTLAETLEKWREDGIGRSSPVATEVARAARDTHRAASRELRRRHEELADGRALVARWVEDRAALFDDLEACDWLLDGWPDCCALWHAAPATDRASQRAALMHIAKLLPPVPDGEQEACQGDAALQAFNRAVRQGGDWRDEVRLVEILERQEALRAELPA